MYSRKLIGLLFGLFVSIVLVLPSVSLKHQPGSHGQSVTVPVRHLTADGGGPVPPYPPPPSVLVVDGGGPVPPYPLPVPPGSGNAQSTLLADGGGPVPPYPPKPPSANLLVA